MWSIVLANTMDAFIQKLNIYFLNNDILITFDVTSLFRKVPLKNTLQLLGQHFETSTKTCSSKFSQPISSTMDNSVLRWIGLPWVHPLLQWPIST
jgi:hypothetical protein